MVRSRVEAEGAVDILSVAGLELLGWLGGQEEKGSSEFRTIARCIGACNALR